MMRRKKRQVTDLESIKNLVEKSQVVRIALNGEDYPYVVGKAELLDDLEERRKALHLLMDHAAKGAEFDEIPEGMLKRTGIIKITLDSYTMKENIHPDDK